MLRSEMPLGRLGARVAWMAAALIAACGDAPSSVPTADDGYQQEFAISDCETSTTGRNEFLILEPGFQLVLEGGAERLAITVLEETRTVAGVTTRVVEEREWRDGELVEVSRNFFAICPDTGDVFYFGEEVDDYRDGEIVGHAGAWLAGENGAEPGLIMPGSPVVGMRYYQEIAPEVALDRAEVVSLDETLDTPAGSFTDALKTEEGTALDPGMTEFKTYAQGVGLIQDQGLMLSEYGFVPSG